MPILKSVYVASDRCRVSALCTPPNIKLMHVSQWRAPFKKISGRRIKQDRLVYLTGRPAGINAQKDTNIRIKDKK
jgi:hypothetical protein